MIVPVIQRLLLGMLFPLLAILIISVFAGGLGIIFMILEVTMGNEWGVIILGVALVVGVPTAAFMLERAVEK